MFQVSRAVPRPIAMFVDRGDSATIPAAIDAAVSPCVVDGLRQARGEPTARAPITRFNAFDRLRRARDDAQAKLAGRTSHEQDKDILMKPTGKQQGKKEE